MAHTPEAEEVLRGARMRMARKPSAVARELLRNFPKGSGKKRRRRSKRSRENEGENRNGREPQLDSDDVEAIDEPDLPPEDGDDGEMPGTAEEGPQPESEKVDLSDLGDLEDEDELEAVVPADLRLRRRQAGWRWRQGWWRQAQALTLRPATPPSVLAQLQLDLARAE